MVGLDTADAPKTISFGIACPARQCYGHDARDLIPLCAARDDRAAVRSDHQPVLVARETSAAPLHRPCGHQGRGLLVHESDGMAREFGPYGITVNPIAPAAIETDMSRDVMMTSSPAAAIQVPRLRLLLAFGERGRPHGCFGRNRVPLAAGLEDEEPADAQLRLAHGEQPPFPPRLVLDGHLDHRGLPGLHRCRICRKLLTLWMRF